MRALALAGLFFLGCGSGPGVACSSDAQCGGDLVCSTTAGDTCTTLCPAGVNSGDECAPVNGTKYWCGKYIGPTSAGYACAPR